MVASALGLSPIDLGSVREALSTGRHPKVVFTESAGQIAGQVGQVVALADPATSDEWIVVRFGKDELPFAAHDLAIPARGRTTRSKATSPPPLAAPPRPAPPRPAAAVARKPRPARANGTAPVRAPVAEPAVPPTPKVAPRAAKRPPSSLSVTLTYADRAWSVTATVGSRTVSKPQPVRPADALRMVALVNLPALHDAVEAIIATERAEAESKAQRLRSELAEIESRLNELTR